MQRRLHGGGAVRATGKSMRAARQQRRAMSPPEVRLWALLRRAPEGVRFRRQHPIGPYVADFYCAAAKLVIEVDGLIHDFTAARDEKRDEYMRGSGLKIVRVPASEIMVNPLPSPMDCSAGAAPPPLSCAERSPSPLLRNREDVVSVATAR